jgi:hypothetical protein
MKAKQITICLFFFVLISVLNCTDDDTKCGCDPAWPQLYKLKADYTKNVCVMMDQKKTRIKGYPSPGDGAGDTACHPIQLINGYYLDYICNYGVNSAYLKISREEFINWVYEVPADSYKYYLLDTDPFLEYYEANYKLPNDTCDFDTTCLNKLIRNNEIELFFDRLK